MRVIDPGHEYSLDSLDGEFPQTLVFVKREGAPYPGNVGSHPGTTCQEVLRALISRLYYVQWQTPCPETALVIGNLESALYLLEVRAARRHGRMFSASMQDVTSGAGKCRSCGHVGCPGCHRQVKA